MIDYIALSLKFCYQSHYHKIAQPTANKMLIFDTNKQSLTIFVNIFTSYSSEVLLLVNNFISNSIYFFNKSVVLTMKSDIQEKAEYMSLNKLNMRLLLRI